MQDPKEESSNTEMVMAAVDFVKRMDRILKALVVDGDRSLEELNGDWTASQELADVLMRKYQIPFRIGHNFSGSLVRFAKQRNYSPNDFPYEEARRIFAEAMKGHGTGLALPLTEMEFRDALNPIKIIDARATHGGPQPSEMNRMLGQAKKDIEDQKRWVEMRRKVIDQALRGLNDDFRRFLR
jgi:argininosuccinate lyase